VLGIYFTTASRPDLRRTQPSNHWTPGALSLRVKRPRREGDHSHPCSAEVRNVWCYTSTLQHAFNAWYSVKIAQWLYFCTPSLWLRQLHYISFRKVVVARPAIAEQIVDRTREDHLAPGQKNMWGVSVPPMHFLQCSFYHSGGVRTRIFMQETGAFEWLTTSFWTKGWLYSVFKNLWIISCVDDSLFFQKMDE